jgi:hypothetical protein
MPEQEVLKEMKFPLAGIDLSQAFYNQQPRPVYTGQYARSTPVALNVRGYEPGTGRARGGSRPGLAKWIPELVPPGQWIVQCLAVVTINDPSAVAAS